MGHQSFRVAAIPGADMLDGRLSSYVDLEQRTPENHPLRRMRLLVDAVLGSMSEETDRRCARTGRPSIALEYDRPGRASMV